MARHRKKSIWERRGVDSTSALVPSLAGLRDRNIWIGIAVIIFVILYAYAPSMHGGFIFDDDTLLTDNEIIKSPDGLYRFWCTSEPPDYWPMTNSSFWIEWRLWGMDPVGYHSTNVVLHCLSCLLIWAVLHRLSIPGAFLAALLFAVHPVNVESVAWISQRKNVLSLFFFLIAFYGFVRTEEKFGESDSPEKWPLGSKGWYGLSLFAFLMSMLSKGSTAMFPVLALTVLAGRRVLSWKNIARQIPFFVIAAVLTCVNIWFALHDKEIVRQAGAVERLLGAGGVVWFYLYQSICPIDLIFFYPQWIIDVHAFWWWIPLGATVATTVVLWRYRNAWSRPFFTAWVFFCVALVPVMGFSDVGYMKYSLVADRYVHVALLGLLTLGAAGWELWRRRTQQGMQTAAYGTAVVVVTVLALLCRDQSGLYVDAMTLYRKTIEKNPDSWLAHYNLGHALMNHEAFPEAIEEFRRTIDLKPDYFDAYNNWGICLVHQGKTKEAITCFEQAIQVKPSFAKSHYNLGRALADLGRYTEAISCYERAVVLSPHYGDAQNNWGNALCKLNRTSEAVVHYRLAIQEKPNDAKILINYGKALLAVKQVQEAVIALQNAVRAAPDFADAHFWLAVVCVAAERRSEAALEAQIALDLERRNGNAAQVQRIQSWIIEQKLQK